MLKDGNLFEKLILVVYICSFNMFGHEICVYFYFFYFFIIIFFWGGGVNLSALFSLAIIPLRKSELVKRHRPVWYLIVSIPDL